MSVYRDLLEVQAHDTRAEQLRHRRATLPERAELQQSEAAQAAVQERLAPLRERHDELARSQKRLEDEIAQVEEKKAREERNLYSGSISNPRELQAMQEEIDALARRQDVLEEQDLEVMELLEPLDAEIAGLEEEARRLHDAAERQRAALADAEASVDAQLAELAVAREAAVAKISAEVLADYDALRRSLGGVGVAPLENGLCGGCHLRLSAVEVDRIRQLPVDERVTCEECGRLLAR